jgi:hypothetical protein
VCVGLGGTSRWRQRSANTVVHDIFVDITLACEGEHLLHKMKIMIRIIIIIIIIMIIIIEMLGTKEN